jgi:hypothetical protein
MTAEYVETEVPADDLRNQIIEEIAGGHPWVLLVAVPDGDGIGIKAETGGGITNAAIVRKLLRLALDGIPGGAE